MSTVRDRRRVLIVGWDAVDWPTISPLLRANFLPHLARLIKGGVAGDLATTYPVSSPIVWNSVATGVTADLHGIFGYADAPDSGDGPARLVSPRNRLAPAIWDCVAARGGVSHVVNWPCSYPAYPIGGLHVSDAAVRGLAVADVQNAPPPGWADVDPAISMADANALRMAAGEVDGAVLARFLSVGQTVPAWLPPALAACSTVHNFAVAALESGVDWDLAAIRYPGLMPLAVARARGGSDPTTDSDALRELCRLHDLFLGRLLELAARRPQTAVILLSAHGFPARMVGAETDIRAGLIFASGAGVTGANARVTQATVLDVAPTALRLLGWSTTEIAEKGFGGQALSEASPPTDSPSVWSHADTARASDSWRNASATGSDSAANLVSAAREGLIATYQADGSEDAARSLRIARQWAKARALAYTRQPDAAIPLLQTLRDELPQRDDIALRLADVLYQTGRETEALRTLTPLLSEIESRAADVNAEAHILIAEHSVESGRRGDALENLAAARRLTDASPLLFRIGYLYYVMRRIDLASPCFTQASAADPTEPGGWMAKAGMALVTRRYDVAIEFAQRSIAIRYDVALAHGILARALRFAGRTNEARIAYATALRLGLHQRERF